MAAQPTLLARTWPTRPAVPGAINLTAAQLTLLDIFSIATAGATSAQTTLQQLQAFLFGVGPFAFPARVVTTAADAVFAATDVLLLVNLAAPAPLAIALPTPSLGRVIGIKDMAGNFGTDAVTLDAGTGKLINGQQTLVSDANFATTLLIGMSSTAWGTLI